MDSVRFPKNLFNGDVKFLFLKNGKFVGKLQTVLNLRQNSVAGIKLYTLAYFATCFVKISLFSLNSFVLKNWKT